MKEQKHKNHRNQKPNYMDVSSPINSKVNKLKNSLNIDKASRMENSNPYHVDK